LSGIHLDEIGVVVLHPRRPEGNCKKKREGNRDKRTQRVSIESRVPSFPGGLVRLTECARHDDCLDSVDRKLRCKVQTVRGQHHLAGIEQPSLRT
jgi:hypothetical protein